MNKDVFLQLQAKTVALDDAYCDDPQSHEKQEAAITAWLVLQDALHEIGGFEARSFAIEIDSFIRMIRRTSRMRLVRGQYEPPIIRLSEYNHFRSRLGLGLF